MELPPAKCDACFSSVSKGFNLLSRLKIITQEMEEAKGKEESGMKETKKEDKGERTPAAISYSPLPPKISKNEPTNPPQNLIPEHHP